MAAAVIKARPRAKLDVIIVIVAIAMVLYHVLGGFYPLVDQMQHQNLHLAFALVLVFLVSIQRSKRFWPLKLGLILLALAGTGYIQIVYEDLFYRLGYANTSDIIFGAILIIVVFEASRQSFGIILPIFAAVVAAYGFLGQYLPEPFRALSYPALKMVAKLSILEGIYGTILDMSANYIFLFILFGATIQCSGATRFFMQVGRVVGKRLRGGGGMAAVVTSSLVGMLTGSVSANIVAVGSFTIPLMKSQGYRPEQAGAIEAAASTGGQIMPPVMGAAIFLMVAFTGIPYARLIAVAVLPAIFYYIGTAIYVQLQATKLNLARSSEEVDKKEMLLTAPLFIIPLILLVILLGTGFSATYSVSRALIVLIALSLVRKETRGSWKGWIESFTSGAITGAQIGVVCGLLGIIVMVFGVTGLGVRLPGALEALSGGNQVILLLITMVTAIILGCGMTTPAVYVLTAIVLAPALIRTGVTTLQAHFFIFYYACLNFLTPPVAIGALVASKIAGAPYFKTAIESVKVALGGFIVPFLILWCPILLLEPQGLLSAIIGIISSLLLLAILEVVICDYFITQISRLERVLFFMAAIPLFMYLTTEMYSLFALGIAGFAGLTIWQFRKWKIKEIAGRQAQTHNV